MSDITAITAMTRMLYKISLAVCAARFRPKGFGKGSRSNIAMGYAKLFVFSRGTDRLVLVPAKPSAISPSLFELLDDLSQILDRGQLFLDPCGNSRVSGGSGKSSKRVV